MERNRIIYSLFFSALLLFSSKAFSQQNNVQVKVGAVLGLTGPAADQATSLQKGIILAVEDLKTKGTDVEVHFEDDQSNSAKTVSAIEGLIARGIRLFIGPTWGFQVKAAKAVLERANAIALPPETASNYVGGPSSSIFNLCASRRTQLPVLESWLREKNVRKAFIVEFNNEWGELHSSLFAEGLQKVGAQMMGKTMVGFGTQVSEFQSMLRKIQSTGADLIMMSASADEYSNMIKAAKQLHMSPRILGDENLFDIYRLHLVPSRAAAGEVYSLSPVVSPDFVKRFQGRFNEDPALHASRAYDAVMLLAQAVEKAGAGPDAVRSYLKSVEYKGYSGLIRFDENGDVAEGNFRIFDNERPW